LLAQSAVSQLAAIRSRKSSCVELMRATLERIASVNPAVNAIVALRDAGELLAEAQAHDDRLARGEVVGPLFGLPLAIKDMEAVRGIRTTKGSPIFRDHVPDADCLMVGRLRAAGGIPIGKTNVPEFALGSQTYNSVYGATRNAYDQNLTAGGSSGGAAVALATGMLAVADGSDFGGSLRNPAGWNNVFGLRSSIGRVPSGERDPWLGSMSVLGPMARNVPDLALLLSVQAGFDPSEPLSSRDDPKVLAAPFGRDISGTRIAWGGNLGGALPFEPGVLDLCRTALGVFEQQGCVIEEAAPAFDYERLWQAFLVLRGWQTGFSLLEHYRDPQRRAMLKPEAVYEVESAMALTAHDVLLASAVRAEWTAATRDFLGRYDFLILPTAQVFAFPIEQPWPKVIAGCAMTSYHAWMKVMVPATMAGCPALAAPAGFDPAGRAMGIQIIAAPHAERACLELAYAYDRATAWPLNAPSPLLRS